MVRRERALISGCFIAFGGLSPVTFPFYPKSTFVVLMCGVVWFFALSCGMLNTEMKEENDPDIDLG